MTAINTEINFAEIQRKAYLESAIKEYNRCRAGHLAGFLSQYNFLRIVQNLRINCPDFARHMDSIAITNQPAN